jgi:O-antigen/teichoic acid export membrane protein
LKRSVEYFSEESLGHDLKGKAVRGGLYTSVAQAVALLANLAALPVLARLLEPSDFGLVAMVTVFTGLAAMFVDAGLTMATIQREGLEHQQVSNLFWISAALGLLISIVVSALAPAVAWLYGEPRLVPITIALAVAPFLSGLTLQHQALLRRAMQIKRLAVIQAGSPLLGYSVAIAVAWSYRSYWALVALPIANSGMRLIGAWIACAWRPSLPRRGANVRGMVGFGAHLTGFTFVNYFARSGDNFLIGWAWGSTALGLYERAYKLMMAPLHQINGPLAGIMIPTLSRLNTEPSRYRRAYFRSVAVFQTVSVPLMAFVAVMAPEIVRVVFGTGYEQAGPILRWLAIAGLAQPLTNSLGWLYVSQGRGRELMRWGLLGSSITVVSFLLGLTWGALGVAIAYAAVKLTIVSPLAIWYAGANGPVSRRDLTRACATAILMAVPTAVATTLVLSVGRPPSAFVGLVLAAFVAIAATLPVLLLTRHGHWLISQFSDVVREAFVNPKKSATSPPMASPR